MAYDKVVDSSVLDAGLKQIADAIRGKTGGTEELTLDGMASAISGLETGGLNLVSGSFTLNADYVIHTFNHNLGKVPSLIVLAPKYLYKQTGTANHVLLAAVYIDGYFYGAYTIDEGAMSSGGMHDVTGPNSSYDTLAFLTAPFLANVTDKEITFTGSGERSVYLAANVEYVYYVA